MSQKKSNIKDTLFPYKQFLMDFLESQSKNAKLENKICVIDYDSFIGDSVGSIEFDPFKIEQNISEFDWEVIKFFKKFLNYKFVFLTTNEEHYISSFVDAEDYPILATFDIRNDIITNSINDINTNNVPTTLIYIGDAIEDIPLLTQAHISGTWCGAPRLVKKYVDVITECIVGYGAIADLLLTIQDTYFNENS